MSEKYQLIIIEPSLIVQQGIKALLESGTEFQVVRSYTDYQSFKDDPDPEPSHIILINPTLVNFHKQFAIKSFFPEYPDTFLVAILYSYVDPETIRSFDGFIDIYDDYRQITKKLKHVLSSKQHHESGQQDNISLSDRETEILISVAQGLTNKEIAEKHYISIHTVISHRKNIARKTGIKTVSGLTIYALFNNLISQEDIQ